MGRVLIAGGSGFIIRSCASIELVKKDFNWLPKVSIEEGITELIDQMLGE